MVADGVSVQAGTVLQDGAEVFMRAQVGAELVYLVILHIDAIPDDIFQNLDCRDL